MPQKKIIILLIVIHTNQPKSKSKHRQLQIETRLIKGKQSIEYYLIKTSTKLLSKARKKYFQKTRKCLKKKIRTNTNKPKGKANIVTLQIETRLIKSKQNIEYHLIKTSTKLLSKARKKYFQKTRKCLKKRMRTNESKGKANIVKL